MLRQQWQDQILHWLGHAVKDADVQVIMHSAEKIAKSVKIVVVPYSLIARESFQRTGTGKGFNVVICDESHYIKEHGSQRTQACLSTMENSEHVILLSGTPSLSTSTELHPQVQAVLGESEDALNSFDEASVYVDEEIDAVDGVHLSIDRAIALAWLGHKDEAVAEFARLIKIPSRLNVHFMRHCLDFWPLRDHPGFLAILDDPVNHQPLDLDKL